MLAAGVLALILADATGILNGLYWGGLIVGGGLLLVSVLGGGHHGTDVDAGTGFDVDHAHGAFDTHDGAAADAGQADTDVAYAAHAGAASLSAWISFRFLVFFLAMFGATGVILTHFSTLHAWSRFGLALVAGALVGQAAHQLFRYIRRTSGDSSPQTLDYVNKPGRVTVGIVPPNVGEVALLVRGTERFVPAVAAGEGRRLNTGEEVVVIAYRVGVAHVVSRAEFEQPGLSQAGGR